MNDVFILELHLIEYCQRHIDYMWHFDAAPRNQLLKAPSLIPFSSPTDPNGYNDQPITDDFITDVYLTFGAKSRGQESMHYCKTRSGEY